MLGTINIISDFTVQAYKATESFKCVRAQNQLIFSQETKIQQLDEKQAKIANEFFDLYDHSEVKPFANQTAYLIGLEIPNPFSYFSKYLRYKHSHLHHMLQIL